jgi:hypothetical protein
LKPIALVVARLAMILEIVAIQEEVIQEKIKVWGRKLPHLYLCCTSAVAKATL